MNFADTHQRRNDYLAAQQLPLVPGGEVAGVREDTGERVVALERHRRLRRVRDGAGGADLPDPRRRRRRHRAGAADPGADRVAPVPHVARASARASRWRRRRRGRRRLARRAARQADGRGPRDRDGLDAGQARPRARAGRRRRGRRRRPRGSKERLIEANVGRQVDVVFEMAGGAVFDASPRRARAVRPPRRPTASRRARANDGPHAQADAPLARGRRLLAHALPRAPGDGRRGARRPLRARRARRAARGRRARPTRCPTPRQAQIDLAERRTTGQGPARPERLTALTPA